MKLLHTSDWHIGQIFKGESRREEHRLFFEWLRNFIVTQNIEALLVSGDIFDVASPSSKALQSYYNFLVSLQGSCCKKVIVTGGNHDGIATLEAPKEILDMLNIDIISGDKKSLQNKENLLIPLYNANNEIEVVVCAVPFLREQVLREATLHQTSSSVEEEIAQATEDFYQEVLALAKKNYSQQKIVAMGHLTVLGAQESESEREIYLGKLKGVDLTLFRGYDYVALGHLHRAQKVGQNEFVRYSGSPLKLSFSEANQTKKVVVYDSTAQSVEEVSIPVFRDFYRFNATSETLLELLNSVAPKELAPFIEISLKDEYISAQKVVQLQENAQNLGLKLLELRTTQSEYNNGNKVQLQRLDEITPLMAFELKISEYEELEQKKEQLIECFKEIEELVYEDS